LTARQSERVYSEGPIRLHFLSSRKPSFLFPTLSAQTRHPAAVLRNLVAAGTDIVLSGHTHMPHVGAAETAASILFLQVGTAISSRLKTRWNDVSLVETRNDRVTVSPFLADDTHRFEPGPVRYFHRKDARWKESDEPSSTPDMAVQ
jgi:hypothetical protein